MRSSGSGSEIIQCDDDAGDAVDDDDDDDNDDDGDDDDGRNDLRSFLFCDSCQSIDLNLA